ncbi:hypothetical protein BY458DRAFT_498801, partial [Sporodiniella umbellata]
MGHHLILFTHRRGNVQPITTGIDLLTLSSKNVFKGSISKYDWEKDPKSNMRMVASSTESSPPIQVTHYIFNKKSTDKKTKVTLVFANLFEEDIVLRI